MGSDITYECLPNGDYVFTVTIYRDCDGTTVGATTTLDFTSPSCGMSFTATLQQIGVEDEVSQVCMAQVPNTTCNSTTGTLPGTEQYIFSDTISFPAGCTDWNYSWNLCCRNNNITNLQTPGSYDLYTEGTLDNTIAGCNNSPQFSSLPTPYICVGEPYCYNHGAFDVDGDSLAYQLVQPLDAAGVTIPWAAGYSTTAPVQSSTGFSFNATTGEMCFTPSITQTCVVSIVVEEWRNGVLIATSMRELQIVVYNCTNQQPFDDGVGILNISGGASVAQTGTYSATVCPGDQICWDMSFTDPNGHNVTVDDNTALSIPGATFTTTGNGTSANPSSQFCWTPTALDTGLHVVTVGVQDDGCPILGGNYYTFSIYVWDQTFAGADQYYCPGGIEPQLNVVGGNTFTWTSIAGDPIIVGTNFSCNPCSNPIATPTQTTTYVVTSDLSAACGNRDTVTVFVVPDFPLTMSPDATICLNEITQISADATDPTQGPYTYSWDPTTGLDDPNVSNPNANPQTTTTYTATVTSASGCTITDDVTVTVSGIGPTVYLTDTTICPLTSTQLDPTVAIEPGFCGPSTLGCTGSTVTATVGNGTFSSSTYSPFYSGTIYEDSKHQYLFTAAELQAAGVVPGKITQVSFTVTTKNSTLPYQNFQVGIGCTNASCLTVANGWLPVTNVYGPVAYNSVLGVNNIVLTTPFEWDGSSNLVIQTCFDNPNSVYAGGYDNVEYTSGFSCDMYMREYESIDNNSGCNLAPAFDYNARMNWTFQVCQILPTSPTYSWTPTTGLSNPNIANPVATPGATTTYTLNVTDAGSGCTGSATVTVTLDSTNYVTAVPDVTLCPGSTAQLDATFFGGQPSPSIPCGYGSACTEPSNVFTVGTGTLSSSTYAPVYSGTIYEDSRHQYIITAAELAAAGITSGTFTTVAWNFTTVNSTNPYQNFRIGMGCTTDSCLSSATGWLPTTNVYGPVNMSPALGWNTYTLTTSFDWDGVSNVVIETCFNNPNATFSGGYDNVQYASGFPCSKTMREYESIDGNNGCALLPAFAYTARPNFQFTVCPPTPTPLVYSWSPTTGLSDPNIQDPVASPTTTTQYVITVTGGYCTVYDTVNVIISTLTPPNVATVDPLCNGGSTGSLTITPVDGVAPYQYSINNGITFQASNNFTGLPAGTYDIVIVDNNGCQATVQVTLTDPPPLVLNVTPTDESCDGANDGSAIGNTSGGTGPFSYTWTPAPGGGQGTANASGFADGNYTVVVTDANGCTANAAFTINPGPAVTGNFSYNGNQCLNGNSFDFTDLSANATSWSWNFGASATPATSTAQNPTGVVFSAAGTYPVTLTAANGVCESIIVINVTVYDQPSVTASGTDVSCNGGSDGTLNAVGSGTSGYTYAWDIPATGAAQTGLAAGTYTVTLTDVNGCTATDSHTITEPPVITTAITGTDLSCNGANDGTATVTAGGGVGGFTYSWAPLPGAGQGTNSVSGLSGTTYTVTITDGNGCIATETFTPVEPGPINVTATSTDANCGASDGTISVTSTTGGSGNYVSTTWVDDATSLPVTDPNAVPSGSYTVTVTDDQGCSGTATVGVSGLAGPTASLVSQTNASCSMVNNGTATVTATGGSTPYTYTWTPAPGGGAGTASVSGLAGGTAYSVTITDAGGCSDVIIVNVGTDPDPTASVTVDSHASCSGVCDGVATATMTGGTAGYSYLWDNGETTQQATALCLGNPTVTITDANGCTATAGTTITEPGALNVSLTGTDAQCNGATDGSADATISGGTAPYSPLWQHGPNVEDLNGVLGAGTYTLDVTDANGCTVSANVTIAEPPAITSTISGTDVSCNGGADGTATAAASGGTGTLTYSWAPAPPAGQGTNSVSGLNPNTYTVTITDANGCFITDSYTPSEPAAIVLTPSATQSNCGQADGSVDVTVTGGTGGYIYDWQDATSTTVGTTAAVTNLPASTYTVTVTDANGCMETAVATITDASGATLSNTFVDVSCNGGADGSIDLTVTGGTAPITYSWTGPGGFTSNVEDLTNLEAGTYNVTVSDAVGCNATTSVTVSEPGPLNLAPSAINALCFGSSDGEVSAAATGGTAGYTFEWYDNMALTNNIGSGGNLTGLPAGTYYVEVTDANGCTESASIVVAEPADIVVSVTSTNANCGLSDGSVSVTGTTGGSGVYVSEVWMDATPATVSNPAAVPAGTYTVTVTDDNGCTGSAIANVTDLAGPTTNLLSVTDVSCNGVCDGAANVEGNGGTSPYTYFWTPAPGAGQNTATISDLCAGTYTVTVTDANGCQDNLSVTVTEPSAVDVTINSSTDVSGFGLSDGNATAGGSGGTPGYSYEWFNDCPPSTTTGQTGTAAVGLSAGTYSAVVTDANGCMDTTCVTINEPGAIVSTITTVDASCFGSCNGSATVSASGGNPGYTYEWFDGTGASIGQTGVTATGLCAGDYYVEITDQNSITATSSTVTINEPTVISATTAVTSNYNGEDISCAGACDGQVQVMASGGTGAYSYQWNDPGTQTNDVATGLCAGNYDVDVTDANGCSQTFSVSVTEPAPLAINITGTDASCFGICDGDANAVINGGTMPYAYQWNDPGLSTTAGISSLCDGIYDVLVTDANGCTISGSVVINEPTEIILSSDSVEANCGQADGSATVLIISGDGPLTQQWDVAAGSVTTTTASSLASGCYDVTVSDVHGCTATRTICVTDAGAPQVQILTLTDASCRDTCDGFAQVQVTPGTNSVPPLSFEWFDNFMNPIGQSTASATGLCAGDYIAEMTDANGCVASIAVTIAEPTALNASISSSTDVTCYGDCDGQATVVAGGGTAGYTYLWNDPANQTSATATGLCPTNFTVTVTDANGCTTTIPTTIGEPLQILASTTSVDAFCNTGSGSATVSIDQGGVGTLSYSWTPSGQTSATATGLTPGMHNVIITDANGCTGNASATIGNIPPSVASGQLVTDVSCNGNCDGEVTVSMGGTGTAPYSYDWFNAATGTAIGQTTQTATGLCAGDYYCIATDVNSCVSISDTITVNQPDILEVFTAVFQEPSCFGVCDGEVDANALGGTGPYNFQWDDPALQNNPQASALCSGTYNVTVTDDNGCVEIMPVTLTDPPALELDSTVVNANCGLPDGEACVIASGGTGPYTYLWPSSGTASCELGLPAGTYVVQVTDANACVENVAITVSDLSGPTATITAQTEVSCNGLADGSATVDMTGGAGTSFTVQWDANAANQTTPTASNLAAGIYTVTITDDLGCSASTSATITEPDAMTFTTGHTDPSCFGYCDGSAWVTTVGGTPTYNYDWLDAGLNPLGINNDTATALCGGSYILNVTDANGCSSTLNFNLTDPAAVSATVGASDILCNGACDGTATATGVVGVGSFTYQWDAAAANQTTATATGLCPGTYTCTVSDADGCFTNVTTTVTEPTVLTASITMFGHVTCNGACDGYAQVDVTGGTAPYTFSWGGAGTTQNVTNLCAGNYTATVTDANGCVATANIVITQPAPLGVTATSSNNSCYQSCNGSASVSVSGGTTPYTYQWNDPTFSTNPTVNGLCAGTWTCTITDANGCSISQSVVITQPTLLGIVINSVTDANCGQANGEICISSVGGVGPFTYAWNDPSNTTTACLTGVAANCYQITVLDANGCSTDSTICVNDITGPDVTVGAITDVSCFGASDGSMDFNVTSVTGGLTYGFYDAAGNLVSSGLPVYTNLDGGSYYLQVTDAAGCIGQDIGFIAEPNQLNSAVTTSTNVTCNAACDGQAMVSISGGSTPYTISWNDPANQTTNLATNLCAGTWVATITDDNLCTSSASVVITEPLPLSQTNIVDNVDCNGGNDGLINLTVSGGTPAYNYLWTPAVSSGSLASALTAGTYDVDITDQNGCLLQTSITVTEPPLLTLSYSAVNATCSQCNGSASLAVTGGTAPYTYQWLNGGSNPSAATNLSLCPGNHNVIVTDANGCVETITVIVGDEPSPIIDSLVFSQPLCNGSSNGSAEVYASGGTGVLSYLWDVAAGSQTSSLASGLAAGTYCVEVSDVNNCSVSNCVTITEPSPLNPVPDGSVTICYGDSTQVWASGSGGTPGYTINWTPSGFTGTGPIMVNPLSTTDYCFTVTDANGCVSPAACVTVDVLPQIQIDMMPSTSICSGDPVSITSSASGGNGGPYSFTWVDDAGNSHTPTGTGSPSTINDSPGADTWYYVTVSDGCSLEEFDSVYVTIDALPTADLTVLDSNGCEAFTANFNLDTDIGVNFDFDFDCDGVVDYSGTNSTPSNTYGNSGLYDVCVTVTSADGCVTNIMETGIVEVYPVPTAGFTPEPTVTTEVDPSVTMYNGSSGAINYIWTFGDGDTISGVASDIIGTGNSSGTVGEPTHFYENVGTYDITQIVTNQYGCTDQVTHTVTIQPEQTLYVPNSFTPNGDGKNDFFFPQGQAIDEANFEMFIFDRWGELIYETSSLSLPWDGSVKGRSGSIAKTDVYVWLIRTRDLLGNDKEYKGHVTLLR